MSDNDSLIPYLPQFLEEKGLALFSLQPALIAGIVLATISGVWWLGRKFGRSADGGIVMYYLSDDQSPISWVIKRDVDRRSKLIDEGQSMSEFILDDINRSVEKIIKKFAKECFYKKKDESHYGTCERCGDYFFPYKQLPKNVVREFDLYDWRLWSKTPEELEKDWNEIFVVKDYNGNEFFEVQDGQDEEENISRHMAKLIACKMIPAFIQKVKKEEQERMNLRVVEGEVCQYSIDRELERRLDLKRLNPVRYLLSELRGESGLHNWNFWGSLHRPKIYGSNIGEVSNFDKEVLGRLYLYNLMFESLLLEKGKKPRLNESLLRKATGYLKFAVEPNLDDKSSPWPTNAENWKNLWRYNVLLNRLQRGYFINNPVLNTTSPLRELATEWITGLGYGNDPRRKQMGDAIMGKLLRWGASEDKFLQEVIESERVNLNNKQMTPERIIKFQNWLQERGDLCKLAIYNTLMYLEDVKNGKPESYGREELMKIFEEEAEEEA